MNEMIPPQVLKELQRRADEFGEPIEGLKKEYQEHLIEKQKKAKQNALKHFKRDPYKLLTEKEIDDIVYESVVFASPIDVAQMMKLMQNPETNPCGKCGICCRICDPILLPESDFKNFSRHFGIKVKDHVKMVSGKWYLSKTKPCEFITSDNKCSIYNIRPLTCRAYPVNQNLDNDPNTTVFGHDKQCQFVDKFVEFKTTSLIINKILEKENPELFKKMQDEALKVAENVLPGKGFKELTTSEQILKSYEINEKLNKRFNEIPVDEEE